MHQFIVDRGGDLLINILVRNVPLPVTGLGDDEMCDFLLNLQEIAGQEVLVDLADDLEGHPLVRHLGAESLRPHLGGKVLRYVLLPDDVLHVVIHDLKINFKILNVII